MLRHLEPELDTRVETVRSFSVWQTGYGVIDYGHFLIPFRIDQPERQRKLEKIREQLEFEVNVRAEHEITKVLEILQDIQLKMGIHKKDEELYRKFRRRFQFGKKPKGFPFGGCCRNLG